MNFIKLSILLLLFAKLGLAQESFINGIIVTVGNDTIHCKVPRTTFFDNRISIIKSNSNKKVNFKASEVAYLATEFTVFQNIRYVENGKTVQKLMNIISVGAINLYYEERLIEASAPTKFVTRERNRNQIRITTIRHPPKREKTYVVGKNGEMHFIPEETYIDVLLPLIEDYSLLKNQVAKGLIKYSQIQVIADTYNKYHSLYRY
ncbi:hypothetical protein [uncultured Arcticibacterium sp.]|uniref:hypothetical protein n=1 Tax=uncultured Arcticibacterium sp. TaxID=2173042 RepID=UPI0030F9582C